MGEALLNPQNVTASVTVTVVSSVWERLDAAISSAREKDPEDYTQESWDAVQKALDAAQAGKNAQQPNDQDAENAATALEQALDALVRDVDKTVLLENLETAEKILENELENHYTAESWKALADVYEEAERVYADNDADQTVIDQAAEKLKGCLEGLEKRPEIEELEALVQEAGELDKELYTEESWNNMTAALNNARAVLLSENADEETVKDAAEALRSALEALQEAGEPEEPGGSDPGDTDDTGNGGPDQGSGDPNDGNQNSGAQDNGSGHGEQEAVQTGDPIHAFGMTALAGMVSAVVLAAVIWKKKRI